MQEAVLEKFKQESDRIQKILEPFVQHTLQTVEEYTHKNQILSELYKRLNANEEIIVEEYLKKYQEIQQTTKEINIAAILLEIQKRIADIDKIKKSLPVHQGLLKATIYFFKRTINKKEITKTDTDYTEFEFHLSAAKKSCTHMKDLLIHFQQESEQETIFNEQEKKLFTSLKEAVKRNQNKEKHTLEEAVFIHDTVNQLLSISQKRIQNITNLYEKTTRTHNIIINICMYKTTQQLSILAGSLGLAGVQGVKHFLEFPADTAQEHMLAFTAVTACMSALIITGITLKEIYSKTKLHQEIQEQKIDSNN